MSIFAKIYVSQLLEAIDNLSHPFFPLVLFHLVWGDWVVVTDEPREREKNASSQCSKIQCRILESFQNFSKIFWKIQKWAGPKKQAGSSRIMEMPFLRFFGLSHFFEIPKIFEVAEGGVSNTTV